MNPERHLLFRVFLCLWFSLTALEAVGEQPPEPEYPYPKTTQETLQREKPIKMDSQGAYYYSTKKKRKKKFFKGVEKPTRMDDDGVYYYDTETKTDPKKHKNIEEPTEVEDDGTYYYAKPKRPRKKVKYGPKPSRVDSDGAFIYDADVKTQTNNVISVRAGVYGPPNIQPSTDGGLNFNDVYSSSASFIFTGEYSWKLTNSLTLKVGSGLTSTDGKGQFANGSSLEPRESFQLFVFPNTASVDYKVMFWDTQYVTPYVDAGLGYFTFAEIRSDGDSTRFGGAAVAQATAGLLLSIDKIMGGTSLQSDYGVNESWMDLQFRRIIGIDSRKDFSGNMMTLGIAVGF